MKRPSKRTLKSPSRGSPNLTSHQEASQLVHWLLGIACAYKRRVKARTVSPGLTLQWGCVNAPVLWLPPGSTGAALAFP